MARLLLLPLLAAIALLGAAPPPAAAQNNGMLNVLPQPRLHEVSFDDLESTLDMLTDLLEERRMPSGEKTLVSRLAAPTLQASSELCRRHTEIYWQQFTGGSQSVWPFLMFDATGKLPDGILAGNLNAFGSMDECFLVKVNLDNNTYTDLSEDELHFTGRYVPVSVALSPTAPEEDSSTNDLQEGEQGGLGIAFIGPSMGIATGTIGMCVPSSCSSGDVRDGLEEILGGNVTVNAFTSRVAGQEADLQASDIVVITIMVLIGVLLLAGTALDVRYRYAVKREADELRITSVADSANPRLADMLYVDEPKPAKMKQRKPPSLDTWQKVLIAFSLYTNTKKLLDTTTSKGTLTCVHGIRFFSMTWVLMGHTLLMLMGYDQNLLIVLDWLKTPMFQMIDNATPSVDTFYLLSGVVLAYSFCGAYEKKRKFNIILFYVHRYLRLTPPMAMIIALTATVFVYFGEGPLWTQYAELQHGYCQDSWWRNLLYIQNFSPIAEECLGQTWYLATDMQMFVFSPLVLLPLVWKPLLGVLWLCFLTIAFLVLRVTLWSTKNLPPTNLFFNPPDPEIAEELTSQYAYPWMRCTVWLTGVGLGYLLHRLRGRQLTLKPWIWLAGWVAAFAIGISVIFGMVGYQMPWQEYSKAVAVTYGGLNRTAWGVAVAWVIFACVTGHGGPINTFLSYPGFIPLSRLTYAGYLIHMNVLLGVEGSVKGTVYLDGYRLAYRVLGHVIVTFAAAMVVSLAFEAPFINLEKIAFEPKKPTASLGTAPAPSAETELKQDRVDEGAPEPDHEAASVAKQ